jgi:plastocyanin
VRVQQRVLPALAAAFVAVAIGVGLPAFAATHDVTLQGSKFDPASVTVNVGDTVHWTHNDPGLPHSVTAWSGATFDSSPGCPSDTTKCMKVGDTYDHKFTKAGTVKYYCKIHGSVSGNACSGMCGTVVVKSNATPQPTLTPIHTAAHTTAPSHTSAATTAPKASTSAKPSSSPTPTPTTTITPPPTDNAGNFVTQTGSPLGSPIAFGSPKKSNRGPLIGIGVAAIALAAGGGILMWFRLRG